MAERDRYRPGPNELSEMVFAKSDAEALGPKESFQYLLGKLSMANDRGDVDMIETVEQHLSDLIIATPDLRSDPAFDQYIK